MKTLRIIVGVVLFSAIASAQCAFKYNPVSPFLAYVCAGTTGPGIGGASSLTGTGGVLYDASAGTAGVSTGFLRTGVGKYTLYDPTATTGSTTFTIKPGAGQASTNLFDLWLNTAGSTPGVHVTPGGYLGVGNNTPSTTLDVRGSYSIFDGSISGKALLALLSTSSAAVDAGGSILLGGKTGNTTTEYMFSGIKGAKESAAAGDYAGYLSIWTTAGLSGGTNSAAYERLRVAANGSVGIGSTNKLSRLTVTPPADASNIGGTTTANASTTITGSGTTFLTSLGIGDRISLSSAAATYATVTAIASDTSLTVDAALGDGSSQTINRKSSILRLDDASNATKFVVADNGNVGVGTASPGVKLEVATSTAADGIVAGNLFAGRWNDDATYAVFAHSNFRTTTSNTKYALIQSDTGQTYFNSAAGQALNFGIGGVRKMVIDSTGNTGIGSINKLSRLTVTPPADATNIGGTTTANASTTITGSGTTFLTSLGIGDRISLSSAAATYATVTAIASDTSLTVDAALGDGSSQTINRKSSIFRLDNASNATKFVVADNGNVGVGKTNPAIPAEVWGTSSGSSVNILQWATTGDGGQGAYLGFDTTNKFVDFRLNTNATYGWRFQNQSGTNLAAITNAGNVGIGTTSPAQKLDVNGTIGGTPGGTVPACSTTTVAYSNAAFQAAATDVSVTLFALPAKGKLTGMTIKHTAQYTDGAGAMTEVGVSVGDGTSHTAYSASQNIGEATAVADTTFTDTAQFKSTTMAASNVVARFTATGRNFGDGAGATYLTAGSVNISACWVVLP